MYKRLYLLVLLIVAGTVITLTSTYLFYRTALSASEAFLKAQSMALSSTIEASLTRYGLRQEIFKDIILSERWEGIAFLAFYDREGVTILHSNEKLINSKINASKLASTLNAGNPEFSRMVLGTGENVFILDTPVVIQRKEGVLRIALHAYPSQTIIEKARVLFISVSGMLVLFWIITILFIRSLRKRLKLESLIAHNERMAMLGRMASVLAHEIRNPLGSIKGFAQYLKEHLGKTDERTEKSINIIIDESKRLELLTEDLLIYARIDELRTEKIDVISLIRDVITSLAVKEREILINFNLPERLMIVSDKEKLRQVIFNLLQNSIDAIGSKGKISLSVKEDDHFVEITVSDTGKGIGRDEIERIFTPFYTTKVRGTGLGLAIVDKLVKVLGGSIRVESEPNQYTTFIMRVPDIKRVDTLSGGSGE